MPAPRSSAPRFVFRLPKQTLKIVGVAFGVGMMLFMLAWLDSRRRDVDAPAVPATAQPTRPLDPLPAPLAAGDDGAADMPDAKPAQPAPKDDAPSLAETSPTPLPSPSEATPTNVAVSPTPAVADDRPLPIQGQMPPPAYPPAALRRGESGHVVVRVDVDANGSPGGVTLIQRSGSRELDRAAMEAVRGWRFRPARQNGQPVAGSIDVPFDFKPSQ